MKIDIPRLLLHLRGEISPRQGSRVERLAFKVWAKVMTSPALYKMSSVTGRLLQRVMPIARAWTNGRDVRPIESKSFTIYGPMNNSARESILGSIRTHLATSAPFEDHRVNPANPVILSTTGSTPRALPELFKESVESVSGHCIITTDTTDAVKQLLTDLNAQRVATSDNQLQKKETSCANYFCYCSF